MIGPGSDKKVPKPSWQAFTPPPSLLLMPIWKQHISKGGFPNWYEHSSNAIRSLLFLSLQKQPLLMSPGITCLEAKMLVSQMLGQRRILCLQIERFTKSFVCTLFKSPHHGLDFHLLLLRLIVVKEREGLVQSGASIKLF